MCDYEIGSCLAILTMGLCKTILRTRSKKFGVEEWDRKKKRPEWWWWWPARKQTFLVVVWWQPRK